MNLREILKEFDNLPRFEDGRINYKGSNRAAVLMCFVKFQDEILILKRSDKVMAYHGKWNGIGGFIDEDRPVSDKVLEELREEIGVNRDMIKDIKVKQPYELVDSSIDRTWIIFPVLAELLKKPEIKLDWEHTNYKWIKPKEIGNFDLVIGLAETLRRALDNNMD